MGSTLEITIQRRVDGRWPVVVEHHRAGALLPVRSEGRLQLADEPTDVSPRSYGTTLGKALFRDTVRDAFVRARNESAGGMRVLVFVEAEELKSWRWEWLCGPVDGDIWDFLSLDQRVRFSLYLPSLTDRAYPPIGRHDLRALVVVAGPVDPKYKRLARFDVEENVRRLQSIFGDQLPAKVLAFAPGAAGAPTLDEIVSHLTTGSGEGPYTILHLVCHGWVNPNRALNPEKETTLYLEQGVADPVSGRGLAQPVNGSDLIERLRRVARLPYLIFLSTCESAAPEAEQRLGGLAQRMVRELGTPFVIGMTEQVTIATAHALAEEFYRRLLAQARIGEVDRALVEAYASLVTRPDVNAPALYSRLGAQPLFSLALDRQLTPAETRDGLEELDKLLVDRAPVLQSRLAEKAQKLQPLLGTDPDALAASARQERETALTEINELCQEAVEINFNALAQGEQPPAYDSRQPFRGLYPFRAEDREFFFGREAVVEKLRQKLNEDNFLPVLGPSGSGKSSLVLAGLVPKLKEDVPGLQVIDDLTPGSAPMEQLRIRQAKLDAGPVLYIVDQFEELFTLCKDEEQRKDFIEGLLRQADSNRVVLTMRADFWGECASYPAFKERMQARQELIAPMTTNELRGAMEKQAAKVGLRFEADLSNTMLDEVAGEPGAMPLIQHALLELWKRRHGRWLKAEEYRSLGGVKQAIARTAEDFFGGLRNENQERVRNIFVRLTRLGAEPVQGEDRRDTRRRVAAKELVPAGSDPAETKVLVARLAGERLVVTGVNTVTGEEEVEVAHEALIRHWPRLREWLDADRSMLRLRENIRQAAMEWEQHRGEKGEESFLIHRGGRLEDAEALSNNPRFPLSQSERGYINKCVELRDREQREKEEQQRKDLEAANKLAEAQRQRAEESERLRRIGLAQALCGQANRQPVHAQDERAVLLARQAFLLNRRNKGLALDQIDDALRARLAAPYFSTVMSGPQAVVFSVAFSPDGQRLAAGGDSKVQLWDLQQPEAAPRILNAPEGSVHLVAFSRDWEWLAVGSSHGKVRLWRLRQPKAAPEILGTRAPITSVAFSPDGERMATSSDALFSRVRLWELRQPEASPIVLGGDLRNAIESVAFSPDGERLAASGTDGTVRLWKWQQPEVAPLLLTGPKRRSWEEVGPGVLMSPITPISSVAFSPDGQRLAMGNRAGVVWLWTWQQPEFVPVALKGPQASVESVAFSPDGQQLAAGGADRKVWLWKCQQPEATPLVLNGAEDVVYSVAFSPDGHRLAAGSGDGKVRLWDLLQPNPAPLVLDGPEGSVHSVGFSHVHSVAFSPDGSRLAAGSFDGRARLWNLQRPKAGPEVLVVPDIFVFSVAFSPDGERLAVGGEKIRLWDLRQSEAPPVVLSSGEGRILSVAFAPDGQRVAGGDEDGKVWLHIARTERLADLVCAKVRRNLTQAEWSEFIGPEIPYECTCQNLPPGEGATAK